MMSFSGKWMDLESLNILSQNKPASERRMPRFSNRYHLIGISLDEHTHMICRLKGEWMQGWGGSLKGGSRDNRVQYCTWTVWEPRCKSKYVYTQCHESRRGLHLGSGRRTPGGREEKDDEGQKWAKNNVYAWKYQNPLLVANLMSC